MNSVYVDLISGDFPVSKLKPVFEGYLVSNLKLDDSFIKFECQENDAEKIQSGINGVLMRQAEETGESTTYTWHEKDGSSFPYLEYQVFIINDNHVYHAPVSALIQYLDNEDSLFEAVDTIEKYW